MRRGRPLRAPRAEPRAAALLYVGQYHGARFDLGSTDLLTVIAAAIIGGTALAGGKGSVGVTSGPDGGSGM